MQSLLLITICNAQWMIQSDPKLPRADALMIIGSYNGSIYMMGGASHRQQVFEYDIKGNVFNDEPPNYGQNILPNPGLWGDGTYYSQINNTLHVIDYHDGSDTFLSSYNMETKAYSSKYQTIPTFIDIYSCLASSVNTLFVVGGYTASDTGLNTVQIFTLSTNEWTTNVPTMNQKRLAFACIVDPDTNVLYTIAGHTFPNHKYVYTETVERIDTNHIMGNTWDYIGNLSLAISWTRSVYYKHTIFVIGGAYGPENDETAVGLVHEIDTISGQVTVSKNALPSPLASVAAIITNDMLYAFGGYDGSHTDTWMAYDLLSDATTMSPTNNPITTDPTSSEPTISEPTQYPTKPPTQMSNRSPTKQPTQMPSTSEATTKSPSISTPTDVQSTTVSVAPFMYPAITPTDLPPSSNTTPTQSSTESVTQSASLLALNDKEVKDSWKSTEVPQDSDDVYVDSRMHSSSAIIGVIVGFALCLIFSLLLFRHTKWKKQQLSEEQDMLDLQRIMSAKSHDEQMISERKATMTAHTDLVTDFVVTPGTKMNVVRHTPGDNDSDEGNKEESSSSFTVNEGRDRCSVIVTEGNGINGMNTDGFNKNDGDSPPEDKYGKCANCEEYKMGRLYVENGFFYCNECLFVKQNEGTAVTNYVE